MDVKRKLAELLEVEGDLDARKVRKTELRAELEAEALTRWREEGAAPSWKAPGLGSASLCGTDSREPVIRDAAAWEAWAAANHPESVTLVLRLPAGALGSPDDELHQRLADALVEFARQHGGTLSTEVEPLLLSALSKTGAATPDGRLVAKDGDLVAGVEVREKEPYLRVVLDKEAKARARAKFGAGLEDEPIERVPDAVAEQLLAGNTPHPSEERP